MRVGGWEEKVILETGRGEETIRELKRGEASIGRVGRKT